MYYFFSSQYYGKLNYNELSTIPNFWGYASIAILLAMNPGKYKRIFVALKRYISIDILCILFCCIVNTHLNYVVLARVLMATLWHGNVLGVTDPVRGKSAGHRRIPLTKYQ